MTQLPFTVAPLQRVVIVFGNCQADALALLLSRLRRWIEGLKVLYFASYDKPGGCAPLAPEDVGACEVLLQQHDPQQFPMQDLLPKGCQQITFPSLDFNLLWPLGCVNPYNHPDAEYPEGRFPYGDSLVVHGVEDGLSREEILALALSDAWQPHWHNLDRLFSLESARLTARDAQCDVAIAPYVFEHFRSERLFWTPNHPTNLLLAQLCSLLLERAFGSAISSLVSRRDALSTIGPADLLGNLGVPIHPHVAEHFGVEWYRGNQRYPYFNGHSLTRSEYYERMVDDALAARRA